MTVLQSEGVRGGGGRGGGVKGGSGKGVEVGGVEGGRGGRTASLMRNQKDHDFIVLFSY